MARCFVYTDNGMSFVGGDDVERLLLLYCWGSR